MSTHGVFVLKLNEDIVVGFHLTHDGDNVKSFYEENKNIKKSIDLFWKAFYFFTEGDYSDCPDVNIFTKAFDPDEDYSSITSYTVYFDGKKWYGDVDE